MMKKVGKVLITIVISLIVCSSKEVNATRAFGHFDDQKNTGIYYPGGTEYLDPWFHIEFTDDTGKNPIKTINDVYCLEPGLNMSRSAVEMECTHLRNDNSIKYIINSGANHVVKQLALRLIALQNGLLTHDPSVKKSYAQKRDAILGLINGNNSIYANTEPGKSYLEEAKKLYNEAISKKDIQLNQSMGKYTGDSSSSSTSNANTSLVFEAGTTSETANSFTITYNVKTNNNNSINGGVNFGCKSKNKCEVINQNWSGNAGTVTVRVNAPDCDYTILAYYDKGNSGSNSTNMGSNEAYYCEAVQGTDIQNFIILVGNTDVPEIGETIGANVIIDATQTFSAHVPPTGGNYAATYCDGGSCTGDAGTQINIPTYCDDANGEKITIEGPSNVACLFGKTDESGASYQDTAAVSASNPYCAVYCKEDYEMNLPGAQYANSGRYFRLKNTTVTGTRSCYLAGPDGESSGVDLAKYRSDVIEAQKRIVTAYNRYSGLKALYDNIKNATKTDTKDCDGNEYTKYTLSVSYSTYSLNCNASTGKCSLIRGSATATDEWGKSVKTDTQKTYETTGGPNCGPRITNPADANYGKYQCGKCSSEVTDLGAEPSNPGEFKDFGQANEARTALTSAIDSLKKCYNWNNNFCFEPEVEFDYNEEYANNINKLNKVKKDGEEVGSAISMDYGIGIDASYNIINHQGSINETIQYAGCDSNGCSANMNTATGISTNVTHMKIQVTESAEYNNTQNFQTNYPHGTIDTVTDQSAVRQNYSYLGAVFPVALKTTTGVYNWTLNFKNIGQSNDGSCRLGRLNKVATSLGKVLEDNIGYVCIYVVDTDCPPTGCDPECSCEDSNLPDGYSCYVNDKLECVITEPPEPKCPDCEVYCVNCIFNGNDTYMYRTVGLPDINPTKREMGANWTNEKGVATKNEIESMNEEVYINAEYSYKMTPEQQKKIRDYNKEKGTYIAEDLTYHDQGGYRNAYGTSAFLDDGQTKGLFTELERNTTWTLWTGDVNTEGQGFGWK